MGADELVAVGQPRMGQIGHNPDGSVVTGVGFEIDGPSNPTSLPVISPMPRAYHEHESPSQLLTQFLLRLGASPHPAHTPKLLLPPLPTLTTTGDLRG